MYMGCAHILVASIPWNLADDTGLYICVCVCVHIIYIYIYLNKYTHIYIYVYGFCPYSCSLNSLESCR